ncbi:hypothetical protein EJ08DRAFT_308303 [Tothia fuscella]|uniref:Uncharacterized protein n=1 Tax=Tothia fuscella TaxID=1048955 RepID=A0A9P4NNA1_9PEZI|nr:hypothetical protein EJ08DRAFT_308303 [Tothia fuscella]
MDHAFLEFADTTVSEGNRWREANVKAGHDITDLNKHPRKVGNLTVSHQSHHEASTPFYKMVLPKLTLGFSDARGFYGPISLKHHRQHFVRVLIKKPSDKTNLQVYQAVAKSLNLPTQPTGLHAMIAISRQSLQNRTQNLPPIREHILTDAKYSVKVSGFIDNQLVGLLLEGNLVDFALLWRNFDSKYNAITKAGNAA